MVWTISSSFRSGVLRTLAVSTPSYTAGGKLDQLRNQRVLEPSEKWCHRAKPLSPNIGETDAGPSGTLVSLILAKTVREIPSSETAQSSFSSWNHIMSLLFKTWLWVLTTQNPGTLTQTPAWSVASPPPRQPRWPVFIRPTNSTYWWDCLVVNN